MDGVDLRNRFKRAYQFFQSARKILFVAIGLYLSEEEMVGPQLFLVFLINLFILMYIGKAKALKEKEMNKIDLINETFLAFITFFTVKFTEFVQNEESKYLAAWSFNILILLILANSMVSIIIESFSLFKMFLKKYS